MNIFIAQCNPIVGDVSGNLDKIKLNIHSAGQVNADLIVFSECILTGYPPKDLLLYPSFLSEVDKAIKHVCQISEMYPTLGIILGSPYREKGCLYNAALFIHNGKLHDTVFKTHLPDYDVFQESRYFNSSLKCDPISFKGKTFGVLICEDAWVIDDYDHRESFKHKKDLAATLKSKGAELLIVLTASPFEVNKMHTRCALFSTISKTHAIPLIMVNQVGANDDLIFDGGSCCFDAEGNVTTQFPFFKEYSGTTCETSFLLTSVEQRYHALILGIRDYVNKSSFTDVVIGLSGGIDSAVTCALAVDALGAEHVRGITMPSHYSSSGSITDSVELAQNLGIRCDEVPILASVDSVEAQLEPLFKGTSRNVAEENLQARLRGTLLMTVSNKWNALVLTTGNKSELAVGYCTLYGDMCGALGVLSDVYKTEVYELAHFINRNGVKIPVSSITKAPSAELRPNQTDQDSLPDYDVLDAILKLYIEERKSAREIIEHGFEADCVAHVLRLVKLNEYKRFQSAMGLKLSQTAFGSGWRFPIVAKTPFSVI